MSFYGDYLHWLLVPEKQSAILQGISWARGVDYWSILRHLCVLFCTTYLVAIHRSSICQLNRNTDKSKNRNNLPTCTEASRINFTFQSLSNSSSVMLIWRLVSALRNSDFIILWDSGDVVGSSPNRLCFLKNQFLCYIWVILGINL